jgi:hypothetical protein
MTQNVNMVDDSKSKSANFDDFAENRHDQSVFSILLKTKFKDDIVIIDHEKESWSSNWLEMDKYPFWASRL